MIPVKDNVPLLRFPLVTAALVPAGVAVYLLAIVHGGDLWGGPSRGVALAHGVAPSKLAWEAFFSSVLIAGSLPQLLVNSLALAWFGLNVEDTMGRVRYLVFCFTGATIATLLAVGLAPGSPRPLLGASGAVSAVLGGYLARYPRARVIGVLLIPFFATIVEVPAVLLIAAWLLAQVWLGIAGLTGPVNADWGAAYAGIVGALLLGWPLMRALDDRARYAAKRHRPPPRPVY